MKQTFVYSIVVLTILTLVLPSCRRPELAGEDLFANDQPNVIFTDTMSIITRTTVEDSIEAYVLNSERNTLLVADFQDPVFGNVKADAYMQFRSDINAKPNFAGTLIDSVVLILQYNQSIGAYGDTTQLHTINVYNLSEEIPRNSYSNNQTFETESTPVGSLSFYPQPKTKILSGIDTVQTTAGTDSIVKNYQAAYITVPMTDAFRDFIIAIDTPYTNTVEDFITAFKGLKITADGPTSSILHFDVSSASISELEVHYKRANDTTNRPFVYLYVPSGGGGKLTKFTNSNSNKTGSVAQSFINNPSLGDSLLFIQSLAGTNVQIDVPYATSLGKVIINQAELQFTVAKEGANSDLYPPIDQLVLVRRLGPDSTEIISDLSFAVQANDISLIGGKPVVTSIEGLITYQYTLNISAEFQRMVDTGENLTLELIPFVRSEKGSRVVLMGAKNPVSKATLNVTYTKL